MLNKYKKFLEATEFNSVTISDGDFFDIFSEMIDDYTCLPDNYYHTTDKRKFKSEIVRGPITAKESINSRWKKITMYIALQINKRNNNDQSPINLIEYAKGKLEDSKKINEMLLKFNECIERTKLILKDDNYYIFYYTWDGPTEISARLNCECFTAQIILYQKIEKDV